MLMDWLKRLQYEIAPLSDSAALDAQLLLAHVLGRSRAWVLAHPEAALASEQEDALLVALGRLKNGAPLPYVLGRWEFYGLDFGITPDTLIPRPETELLVEQALDWLQVYPERRWVADVGTGSGCIAVALAVHIPDLCLLATDVSLPALRVARGNAVRHAVSSRISFIGCDLLAGVERRFDLVCANLPYIPETDMQGLEVARREPLRALDGGSDGLDMIRRLLNVAPQVLIPGGLLLLEIGADQGWESTALARRAFPHGDVKVLKDLAGRDRVLRVEQFI